MYKVQDPLFWNERIKEARTVEQAVYLTTKEKWREIENAHSQILQMIKADERVLDAGCGLGQLSQYCTNYIGVDISPDFIAIAKERHPGKNFQVGDLNKLDFPDNSFDWVICSSIRDMVLKYQDKEAWERMSKELHRVGKKLLILDYLKPADFEIC